MRLQGRRVHRWRLWCWRPLRHVHGFHGCRDALRRRPRYGTAAWTVSCVREVCPLNRRLARPPGWACFQPACVLSRGTDFDLVPDGSRRQAATTFRGTLREMKTVLRTRTLSTAKNFGMIGGMFATTECFIESYRAQKDVKNVMLSGCLTGGILGLRGKRGLPLICCGRSWKGPRPGGCGLSRSPLPFHTRAPLPPPSHPACAPACASPHTCLALQLGLPPVPTPAGPTAAGFGCAGFAAFSAAIEHFMG